MRAPLVLLLLLSSLPSEAAGLAACPGTAAFPTADAPLCPAAGTLLEDRYPLMALTISDHVGGTASVLRTAEEVFAAQPKPLPLIFVNTSPEGFAKLLTATQGVPSWSDEKRARLRPVYAHSEDDFGIVDSYSDSWQQDFIKGSFDPRTGLARSRIVPSYDLIGDLKEATQAALSSCGIASDEPLKAPVKRNGYSGGNFDAGPAGTCVLGRSDLKDADWKAYAEDACRGREAFPAPSEWAASTHADEIFKMIPLPGGGTCDFALAFASPRRAQELLAAHAAEPAFHPGAYTSPAFDKLLGDVPGWSAACGTFQEQEFKKTRDYTLPKIEWKTDAGLEILWPERATYLRGANVKCGGLTNGRLAEVIRLDPVLREVNELTQAQMDAFKADVRAFFARRLPECRDLKFLDLPTLYSGRIVVEKDGRHRLGTVAEGTSVAALFPTPTNSVAIGKTLLVPNPYSQALERDIRAQLEALKIRVRFVDTIESHALLGNLHCTTQTFRYCRPR